MRRLSVFFLGSLFGVAAFGQNLLECVNPDVLRGLIFPGERSTTFSATVPARIEAIDVPGQFSWIGSAERDLGQLAGSSVSTSVTAAYRTSLAPEAARSLALDAMAAGGWEIQQTLPGIGNGVFVSASQPVSQTACRGDEAVSVTANELEGRTYVLYGLTTGGTSTACDPRMQARFLGATGTNEHMPVLELPSDPVTGQPVRMQGSGGGSNGSGRSVRVEFELDDSTANVERHFGRQMSEQGWTGDANWSGTSTAGSTWTKRTDAGATVLGTLNVTAVGDAQMMVVLNVVAL